MADNRLYPIDTNYIYLYHLGIYVILPSYPDSVSDSSSVSYSSSTPLARSAPIFSYSGSGPRTVSVSFDLHRDIMTQLNYNNRSIAGMLMGNASYITDTGAKIITEVGDDYVDILVKQLQAMTLPAYGASSKMVNPPIVAMRLGSDIFIKGVIAGTVGIDYKKPILRDGKYALISINFAIQEINPFDAESVCSAGSFRLSTDMDRGAYYDTAGGGIAHGGGGKF